MHSVRRRYVDAVRRSGGAFSLSQQLRGAGKLRAALEADLSFAANRNAAARVSLPDQSDIPLFVARARGAVQSGSAGAKVGRTSRTVPASFQCGSSKALVAAVLFLYGSRLCREAVYVLCGKQGTSGDSCSGDKPPFLPNLALPCAPLGCEAVFDCGGTTEGRQYQSRRCRLCNGMRGAERELIQKDRQMLMVRRNRKSSTNQWIVFGSTITVPRKDLPVYILS